MKSSNEPRNTGDPSSRSSRRWSVAAAARRRRAAGEALRQRHQGLEALISECVRLAMVGQPRNRGNVLQLQATREAAGTLVLEIPPVEARGSGEIHVPFVIFVRGRVEALIVASDPVFFL